MMNNKPEFIVPRLVMLFILVGAVLLAVTGCFLSSSSPDAKDPESTLQGLWVLNEKTAYTFDGNGKGKRIFNEREFPFTYTLEEGEITITFSNGGKKATYTVNREGDSLVLTGFGETRAVLRMTRDDGHNNCGHDH